MLDVENREEQERLRELHAEKERRPLLPLAAARANREPLAYDDLAEPAFTGTRSVEPTLAELRPYIDWQFFFHAWELKGKFPGILDQPAARELYDDATEQLDEIVRDGLLQARGVYGFWPAHAEGDDIVLESGVRFPMLRQQAAWGDSRPNRCLADYVAPAGDHVGAFAVAIHGADALCARLRGRARRLPVDHGEGARRPARGGVRRVHPPGGAPRLVRAGRRADAEELVAESYRGIRPAFGYPACPDHSEKGRLFELLGAESAGLALTESFAMTPAAAVSGLYFGHPQAKYFAVGRVARDQVVDYAARKGMPVGEVERWLRPNLAYDPEV